MCSAEHSSAYCHNFLFFGRHNHSISTPRSEYKQYQPLGVNTDKYATHFSVLWRRKTCNNGTYVSPLSEHMLLTLVTENGSIAGSKEGKI